MTGLVQRLRNQRALQCDVFRAARTERFVEGPTDRAVVNDAVIAGGHAHAIERRAGKVAGAHADVTDDDVGRAQHAHVVFAEADAFAGRGLAGDGEIGIGFADDEPRFERDEAGDDGARTGLFNGFAQAARAGVVQVGDVKHTTAAATEGKASVALGGGKGKSSVRAGMPNSLQECGEEREYDHG